MAFQAIGASILYDLVAGESDPALLPLPYEEECLASLEMEDNAHQSVTDVREEEEEVSKEHLTLYSPFDHL